MSEALKEDFLNDDVVVGFVGKPIMNDDEADEALRLIAEKEASNDQWADYYKAQLMKIKAQNQYVIDNEKARLRNYFESVPHKVSKTQESYELPSGKLIWKDRDPDFERQDDKILEWLKNNGKSDLIKVKEELKWAGLKKELIFNNGEAFLKETGEKVPGITAIERDREFTIGK